jgi:hypothetical protein
MLIVQFFIVFKDYLIVMSQGMNIGAGMVLLLVDPITSWGTILVMRKEFGGRILAIYLAVISVMSLALGYCFSLI